MRKLLFVTVLGALVGLLGGAADRVLSNGNPLPPDARADKVLVLKGERKMMLLDEGRVLKTYSIVLGDNPKGHKQQEGDERTPEGHYTIDYRNPRSVAHLSLHISYPNKEDKARAKAKGVSPGGMIMIHGILNGFGWVGPLHRLVDWTDGCIAVTDGEMDEIWRAVPNGTPIEIRA